MTIDERLERLERELTVAKRRTRCMVGSGALLILGCLSTVTFSQAAEASNGRFAAKVKVEISANDNIKELVTSYVNRELRTLNDVELVDEGPDRVLSILAVETDDSRVALSTVIYSPFNNKLLVSRLASEHKELWRDVTSRLVFRPVQALYTDRSDNLQKICKKIVASFDANELEADRKSQKLFDESISDTQTKKAGQSLNPKDGK